MNSTFKYVCGFTALVKSVTGGWSIIVDQVL